MLRALVRALEVEQRLRAQGAVRAQRAFHVTRAAPERERQVAAHAAVGPAAQLAEALAQRVLDLERDRERQHVALDRVEPQQPAEQARVVCGQRGRERARFELAQPRAQQREHARRTLRLLARRQRDAQPVQQARTLPHQLALRRHVLVHRPAAHHHAQDPARNPVLVARGTRPAGVRTGSTSTGHGHFRALEN